MPAGLLLLAGAINSLKTRVMACLSAFSLAWHLIGTIALVGYMLNPAGHAQQ